MRRFKWKSGTYSSHNTARGSVRLILPDGYNFLQTIKIHTFFFSCWICFPEQSVCVKDSLKLTVSASMLIVNQSHSSRQEVPHQSLALGVSEDKEFQ